MNCESTDDESEIENTLSKNMLQIENEPPVESNFYSNHQSNRINIFKIPIILKT